MTYKEKLKSPKWQKKRLEILQRDEWKCQLCMEDKQMLVIHHKKYLYRIEPWGYPNNFLITLCKKCHNKVHSEQIRPVKPIIKNSIIHESDNIRRKIKNISLRDSLKALNEEVNNDK